MLIFSSISIINLSANPLISRLKNVAILFVTCALPQYILIAVTQSALQESISTTSFVFFFPAIQHPSILAAVLHTVLVSFKMIDGETFTAKVRADSKDELYEKALKQVGDSLRGLIYGIDGNMSTLLSPQTKMTRELPLRIHN